jgi:hypothetical protein
MPNYQASLRVMFAVAFSSLVSTGTAWGQATMCSPLTSPTSCLGQPCDQLGATNLDSDRASILQCLLITPASLSVTDCPGGGGCTWRSTSSPPLVRVSFELVGAGGGGSPCDSGLSAPCDGFGAAGANGQLLQFDALLHRGAVLTVSVGGGGGGGITGGIGYPQEYGQK